MTGFDSLGLELVLALFGAVALALLLGVLRWLVAISPMGRSRRELLGRAGPLIAAIVVLGYVILLARTLFRSEPRFVPLAIALVVAAFVAASWTALRDVASGVFVKAGRVCRVGDQVRVDGVAGRVQRMGLRTMTLETSQGEEALIPYSRIVRKSVLRTPVVETASLHVFSIERPPSMSVSDVKRAVMEAALVSHWASVAREPEIQSVDGSTFEVTLYALDPDRGAEIEARVRRAFGSRSGS